MTEVTQNTSISTETTAAAVDTMAAVASTPVVVETATTTTDTTNWLDKLGDEYKLAKPLQNFKDEKDLAKSYLHLNKLLGDKVNNWSKEDVQGFLSKMGRPESADKYIFPDELGDAKAKVGELGFKLGLNQDQMNDLVNDIVMTQRAQAEQTKSQTETQAKEWIGSLQKEFGTAFDERVGLAKKAVTEFGGEELKSILNETGLGNHPAMVKLFARIGKEFLEEGRVVKGDHAATFGVTPLEAKRQIDMKMLDKEFRDAYMSATHPGHSAALAEMTRLFGLANSK